MALRVAEKPIVPDDLLRPIVAYFNPRRIILFGSMARGDARPDSDFDLLVIVDDETPREKLTAQAGWESQRGYSGAADVIPCRESTYREELDIVGTLPRAAAREGIVVYERE
jgi:uncharacterized protein